MVLHEMYLKGLRRPDTSDISMHLEMATSYEGLSRHFKRRKPLKNRPTTRPRQKADKEGGKRSAAGEGGFCAPAQARPPSFIFSASRENETGSAAPDIEAEAVAVAICGERVRSARLTKFIVVSAPKFSSSSEVSPDIHRIR